MDDLAFRCAQGWMISWLDAAVPVVRCACGWMLFRSRHGCSGLEVGHGCSGSLDATEHRIWSTGALEHGRRFGACTLRTDSVYRMRSGMDVFVGRRAGAWELFWFRHVRSVTRMCLGAHNPVAFLQRHPRDSLLPGPNSKPGTSLNFDSPIPTPSK